ncbi:hypothetical protein [Chryseobacterium sp. W4I1]|uniref:hypothetical protein n=1 Tax=Chryseobacterium sp. W4I1 TaxID=3042293 RepID=UPI002787366E|nr:hypothetical protein [Chryseobacterium sp. W4I1]MDQ0783507.1 hypothetical protein [Chryseobacterium sp. W4I1]
MKKKLPVRLLFCAALVASLVSCRSEDFLTIHEEAPPSKFRVFTAQKDEAIDYGKGFKTLLENYDQINGSSFTKASLLKKGNFKKNESEYVEFKLHSQQMLLDDGERWVVYPIIKNNQVDGLMAGILSNTETEVEFRRLDSGNAYYDEVIEIFRIAYMKNNLQKGLLGKGSGCGSTEDDACGIPDIIISPPPKPKPGGSGPKGGCTGYNNCFDPSVGSGGGGSNTPTPEPIVNPCEKTKDVLNKPNVKQGVNNIKAQALATLSNVSAGEIGFKEKKDGTLAPADVNSAHQVVFNDVTDSYGGYHNHTATGTHMFSPPDIVDALFGFAAAQSTQDGVGNAYLGMIAGEWCNTCPDNVQYIHYVIQYTGTGTELGGYVYTSSQMNQFISKYQRKIAELTNTSLNGNTYIKSSGDLNEKGLEKLFFETLNIIGINGKVNLQRIEASGTVNNVTLNSSGVPTGVPCP